MKDILLARRGGCWALVPEEAFLEEFSSASANDLLQAWFALNSNRGKLIMLPGLGIHVVDELIVFGLIGEILNKEDGENGWFILKE